MKQIIVTFFTFFFLTAINAQVGIGTVTPNSSAALDISDSTKGLLIPRMTAARRLAILNPAKGLFVYQTDDVQGLWYYNGSAWANFGGAVLINTSSGILGGPITSTGNLKADTSLLTTHYRNGLKLNIADTAGKWLTRLYRKPASDSVFGVLGGAAVFLYKDTVRPSGVGSTTFERAIDNGNEFTKNDSINGNTKYLRLYNGGLRSDSLVVGGGGTGSSINGAAITIRRKPFLIAFPTIQGDTAKTFKYGNYYVSQDETYVNGNGRRDAVHQWGYNSVAGAKIVSGEGAMRVAMESEYQRFPGANPEFEFHIAVSANDSLNETRVMTFNADKITNNIGMTMRLNQLSMYGSSGADQNFNFANLSIGGTSFFHRGNGTTSFGNGTNANKFSIADGDNGPVINWTSINPAGTYLKFNAPILVSTSAAYGTSNISAIGANVGNAGYSGFRVFQSGLTTSDFLGYSSGLINTTGTYTLLQGNNLNAAGAVRTLLQSQNGSTASYELTDVSAGVNWSVGKIKSGDLNRSMKISFGATTYDSLLKFNGAGPYAGFAKFRYSVAIGPNEATARFMLPAGTASASTAPMKFTSGTPTTTPETGALHFNNGLLILDSSNSVRDTIATRSWIRNHVAGRGGGGRSNLYDENIVAVVNQQMELVFDSSFAGDKNIYTNNLMVKLGAASSTTAPDKSAQFAVSTTSKGFLPPRITTVQKNAIRSPEEGLIIYDLTLHKLCVFTGLDWETITSL